MSKKQKKQKGLNILGYNYEVMEDGVTDETAAFGRHHARLQKIQIASDLHPQGKQTTVLHEIIEAINYHLQLELEHSKIMSLEVGIFQTLTTAGVDLSPLSTVIKSK